MLEQFIAHLGFSGTKRPKLPNWKTLFAMGRGREDATKRGEKRESGRGRGKGREREKRERARETG